MNPIGRRRPVLFAISDRRRLSPEARTTATEVAALERWIEDIVAADVDAVQLRERDLPVRVLLRLLEYAVQLAEGTQTFVLVNDRVDVALSVAAVGIHLRADGPPVSRVRHIAADRMVGRSIHAEQELVASQDADYLIFGPIFGTTSHLDTPAAGLDALRTVCALSRIPVLAVGGIREASAHRCFEAGAAGIAAIGWFLTPRSQLREQVRTIRERAAQ